MSKSKAGQNAFDTAVYYITFKDRTKKELINKLKEKGYSSHDIELAIEKLSYYGYINDENYAVSYIRANINKKGSRLIRGELLNKGICKEVINEQLEDFVFDEVSVVEDIIHKRYYGADLSDEKSRRRIFGYFVRRGFKQSDILKAMTNFSKKDL